MTELFIPCKQEDKEKKILSRVYFNAKHDEKYYKKYGMNYNHHCLISEELAFKDFRYINWADKNGLVPSNHSELPSLFRKYRRTYRNEHGFDHTTFWRKPGDRWPLFCLTEPYHLPTKYDESFEDIRDRYHESGFNIQFKIYPPSEKSLWYPKSTYMIFWWNPESFQFESYEDNLMGHEDACEFEKICNRRIIK